MDREYDIAWVVFIAVIVVAVIVGLYYLVAWFRRSDPAVDDHAGEPCEPESIQAQATAVVENVQPGSAKEQDGTSSGFECEIKLQYSDGETDWLLQPRDCQEGEPETTADDLLTPKPTGANTGGMAGADAWFKQNGL